MIRWIIDELRYGDWWDRIFLSSLLVGFIATVLMLALPVVSYVKHYGHIGHYIRVHVEGGYESQSIVMSNGQVGFTTIYVPEHDESRWVCDTCPKEK